MSDRLDRRVEKLEQEADAGERAKYLKGLSGSKRAAMEGFMIAPERERNRAIELSRRLNAEGREIDSEKD